ncbi:Z1 domain-containing protein [Paenisporosarcina antarctica]|nr:Z1 domain-containing protein [Paenisporosarcina antarctica]
MVESKLQKEYAAIKKSDLESLALEMYEKYETSFTIPKSNTMRGEGCGNWFGETTPSYRYYWPRYKRYLEEYKKWELETVESINESTNEILRSVGDPNNIESFDVRGLVLGYVQSGKTANFTGLINKAFDVGYKLVIVLAGMHNDLRSQTQIRLEEEIVGTIDKNTDEKIGVAQIRNDGELVVTWTTKEKDISTAESGKRQNFGVPNLLVVKKNKDVLESLKELLSQSIRLSSENANVPVLIIDDEADQASIDTSNPNKNEDPKTINRLIREILELFKRKSYVGYTATPFANLLIRMDAEHEFAGRDLYPKDFVIGLPKPLGYCGPAEYFNVTGYEEDNKPLFIRHLKQEDLDLFDGMKKTVDADKFIKVPESMKESILAFLITIAVRNLRGQNGQHNSMLIHTSRFTDTQGVMQDVIERYYREMSNDIVYNGDSKFISELETLYLNDYAPIQQLVYSDIPVLEWKKVLKAIKSIISAVHIMEINGSSGQALEYHKYKEDGLNVIAIGGDKLSRGLTLEGLSVSYYYRNTNMYDTLMQMGRWFGFRNGYMDLCRIYTSNTIADNFEHMAQVMVELRQEFDYLANNNLTPEQYAVKMLDHNKMSVTSLAKMRSVDRLFNYSGTMQQTRIFEAQKSVFEKNMKATVQFIDSIVEPFIIQSGDTTYHIARNVLSEQVVKYLEDYETASTVNKVDSKKIAEYIKRLNRENKLLNFNVAVVNGTKSTLMRKDVVAHGIEKFPVKLGKIDIESTVIRATQRGGNHGVSKVDIGALVAAKQEFIDLNAATQIERNQNNPLILVYPLHPEVGVFKKLGHKFDDNLVPIGLAFSFPKVYVTDIYEDGSVVEKFGDYVVNKTVARGNSQ